jgi:hypothetical protein
MPKSRGIQGGLTRGRLFDTNIKATSIDEDIFTDQEVLSSIAGDDLVLVLDVSETPDKVKYITRTNFTAGIATVTVTDNEATAENNLITFVADAATTTGSHGLEMDGDFHYNPNTGTLTATNLTGTLGTVSQPNVTTLAGVTTMGAVANALTLTYSDATLFHDANNADTSFSMGTSATEALKIEVLNGGSNKTAESIAFTSYTGSGTGDHGKFTFSVDEGDVMLTIDDGGISIAESGAYEIDGTAILSDSSGTLTLQNVDALDATTEATIETALDTLGNLTSIGSAGSTTNFVAGDVTIYNAVNSGNPSFSLGSDANERLAITTTYDSSAQTLDNVEFATHAASGTANKGKFVFDVDGTDIFDIDDSGINLASGMTFRENGSTVIGGVHSFSAGAIANGDSFIFSDADDSNATKKEALADLATLFAGAGMTATNSVLNVIAGTGIDVTADAVAVDVSDFMTNGTDNYVVTATGTDAMNAEAQLQFDGDVLAITGTGTAKSNKDILTITNDANASDMDGTETSILFNQWYYDGSSPAVADAGRISIGTETDWTSTTSTQDSYMALETALNGTVTENVRITSAGNVGINNTDPGSLLDVRGDAGAPGILTLSTAETTVVDGDKLGRIDFQAPKETGTDAIVVSAAIWAESDVTFDASNNATDLVIALGHSEAAAEKFRFTSQNEIGIAGANYGSDGQVLTSGGAGAAVAWETPTTGDITGVTLTADDTNTASDTAGSADFTIAGGANITTSVSSTTVTAALDSSITLTSSSANEPVITVTNTHADATGGIIKFNKDPGSGQGADSDVMGTITWYGTDASNNAPEELARMEGYVIEADHGSEAGGIKFYVAENDATMTAGLQILGVKDADGEIDVTIGAGAASTTTIAGTLTMGTTAAMTNAGLVSVANQSGITGLGTITSGTWEGTDVGVAHGGTGVSTLTANGVLIGNGTSNVSAVDMSTKGKLLVGDGSGNPQALSVGGSDDHVLTVDSSEATGMKWAAVSAGSATSLDATSSSANQPVITITNTHADATAGFLKFIKDPGSGQGADNDTIGTITFYGTDAGNNAPEELARMEAYVVEADHGSEAGGIKFYVAENDATMTAGLQILGQASDDGEIDVTIAAGAASTTTVSGDLTISGGDITYGNGQNATASVAATAHNAAGKNLTVSAGTTTAGTTNNIAGGALTLQGGQGKGSGAGGDIVFQTANAAGSGSSLNALATALTISDDLNSTFANDIFLGSDSAVLNMGADNDVTFTHDGTTGLTIAANPFEVDSGGNITLDAHTGIFIFQDANTEVLRITESGSGDVTIKLETNGKDLIFTDNGDAAGLTIKDNQGGIVVPGEVMTTKISYTDGDDAITIADGGGTTFAQDVSTTDAKYIKLGGSRMATAEPSSDSTGYGIVIGFDSAGSVAAGDAVCIDSNGKVAQANANAGSVTDPAIGIATNAAGSDGDDCYVLTHGIWRLDAEAFTAGDPVYVGESAGALTKDIPNDDGDYVQRIGVAVSDDVIFVMPSIDVIEHA